MKYTVTSALAPTLCPTSQTVYKILSGNIHITNIFVIEMFLSLISTKFKMFTVYLEMYQCFFSFLFTFQHITCNAMKGSQGKLHAI